MIEYLLGSFVVGIMFGIIGAMYFIYRAKKKLIKQAKELLGLNSTKSKKEGKNDRGNKTNTGEVGRITEPHNETGRGKNIEKSVGSNKTVNIEIKSDRTEDRQPNEGDESNGGNNQWKSI